MADGLVPHYISHGSSASNERPRLAAVVRVRANEVVGETGLERNDRLEVLDVFARELDVEGLDVVLEVLDFAARSRDVLAAFLLQQRMRILQNLPSNDGEDVGCLSHHVGKSDGGRGLDAMFLSDFVERRGDLLLVLGLLGAGHHGADAFVVLLLFFHLLDGLEAACIVRCQSIVAGYTSHLINHLPPPMESHGAIAMPK
jgi:hypothetical protein